MRRLILLLLALAVGAGIGQWTGTTMASPRSGLVVGAILAVAAVLAIDASRARRLMAWLAGPLDAAPRGLRGLWGELGYRIYKRVLGLQREAAQERERLTQFFAAIEASPNGVLLLDEDERITWSNRAAADHFGIDPQGDVGQPVTNLIRLPAFVRYLQDAEFDAPLMCTDPRGPITLSLQVKPYGDGMKLVISQDITERMRNEAMRRDFVANVSHEIRSPLTVLAGFVETLQSIPVTDVERERMVFLMGQQTQRMQALVSDLLTLAKLEGSPRPSADSWVPVASLLRRAFEDAQALSAGRHEIVLSGVGDASESIAGAEPELLSAVGNLMSNAVRYTPDGGRIELSWRVQDGRGSMAVSDSGIGIDPEHLPRLTERFYRVDLSRARDTGGTGLGLSIVKHVAQRHGGELLIESQPGKGSVFRLQFPAARVRGWTVPAPDTRGSTAEAPT